MLAKSNSISQQQRVVCISVIKIILVQNFNGPVGIEIPILENRCKTINLTHSGCVRCACSDAALIGEVCLYEGILVEKETVFFVPVCSSAVLLVVSWVVSFSHAFCLLDPRNEAVALPLLLLVASSS